MRRRLNTKFWYTDAILDFPSYFAIMDYFFHIRFSICFVINYLVQDVSDIDHFSVLFYVEVLKNNTPKVRL